MEHFECHITFVLPDQGNTVGDVFAQTAVEVAGWKFSVIAGDPLLGPGGRYYATKHFNQTKPLETVWAHVQKMRQHLEKSGFNVVRCKVEAIVRDERY